MIDINDAWYRVSVKGIIYNSEGKILLCKEEKGVWDLPGGGLDHGELPDEGMRREINEEMGLEVLEISENPICFITAHKGLSKTRPWVGNLCYEIKLNNLNFIPSDECIEVGFFDKESIKKINTLQNVERVFEKMFK